MTDTTTPTEVTIHKPSISELLLDYAPAIPPGSYDLQLEFWETSKMFNKAEKLILHFIIVDGEYAGNKVRGFYNLQKIIGKPRKKGRFSVGKMSNFAREFFIVLESRRIFLNKIRLDRLPVSHLAETPIRAQIRTVKKVQSQPLALQSQYSVVDKMLGT